MALSTIAPLLVGNLWLLAVALFVSGLSVAPTMVTTMTLVERLIPRAKLTEGMTWTSTGLTVGFAVGASVAGAVIDSSGAQVAYVVSAVAAVVAVTVAFMGRRQLRPAREPEGSHADGHDENDEWSRDQDHVV
jgi:MFS family permease